MASVENVSGISQQMQQKVDEVKKSSVAGRVYSAACAVVNESAKVVVPAALVIGVASTLGVKNEERVFLGTAVAAGIGLGPWATIARTPTDKAVDAVASGLQWTLEKAYSYVTSFFSKSETEQLKQELATLKAGQLSVSTK